MKILERKVSKEVEPIEIEYIPRHHVYIRILDYGPIFLLKEIIIEVGVRTWMWVPIKEDSPIDISPFTSSASRGKVCSFDNAINRAVNDLFSTVYEFENYKEMVEKWENIEYKDEIKTVYKSEKEI